VEFKAIDASRNHYLNNGNISNFVISLLADRLPHIKKYQKPTNDEKQIPMEIEDFHHPRKVIACQG
jgi:hypothetical protein